MKGHQGATSFQRASFHIRNLSSTLKAKGVLELEMIFLAISACLCFHFMTIISSQTGGRRYELRSSRQLSRAPATKILTLGLNLHSWRLRSKLYFSFSRYDSWPKMALKWGPPSHISPPLPGSSSAASWEPSTEASLATARGPEILLVWRLLSLSHSRSYISTHTEL